MSNVVYKIRDRETGLFKVKRPPGSSLGVKWTQTGDTYATLGIAQSAAKATARALNMSWNAFEIVVFELREIAVENP